MLQKRTSSLLESLFEIASSDGWVLKEGQKKWPGLNVCIAGPTGKFVGVDYIPGSGITGGGMSPSKRRRGIMNQPPLLRAVRRSSPFLSPEVS